MSKIRQKDNHGLQSVTDQIVNDKDEPQLPICRLSAKKVSTNVSFSKLNDFHGKSFLDWFDDTMYI